MFFSTRPVRDQQMEAFVHMTGYVGGEVEIRRSNVAVASFRLASTPRIRRGGEWVDGQTTWITVTCFRTLAEHVATSVQKGRPGGGRRQAADQRLRPGRRHGRTAGPGGQHRRPRPAAGNSGSSDGPSGSSARTSGSPTWLRCWTRWRARPRDLGRSGGAGPCPGRWSRRLSRSGREPVRAGRGGRVVARSRERTTGILDRWCAPAYGWPVRSPPSSKGLSLAMPEFIYSMHNVRKALGDKLVLDNITLSFYPGAKIGIVGPNGTGKSTLLKLMAGLEKPNNGDAMLAKDATVGILLQEPPLTAGKTVLENVEEAVADIKALQARMDELGMAMGEPDADFDALMAEMGDVQTELDNRNAWDIDSQLEQAMDALRCPPPDAEVDVLSGGERRRVALCKLLLQQPDLLLLDEPTNHLDAESVNWLEGHLKAYPGAVLAVTHDRYFLDNVAEWILEIDRGKTHPYEGNYSTYLDTKRVPASGRGQAGRQAGQDLGAGAGLGPLQPQGPAGQEQGAAVSLRGDGGRGGPQPQAGLRGDQHPGRSAPGQPGAGREQAGQGLRGPAACSTGSASPCRGRASSA